MASGQGTTERGFKQEPKSPEETRVQKNSHPALVFEAPRWRCWTQSQSQTLTSPSHLRQEPWIYREEFLGPPRAAKMHSRRSGRGAEPDLHPRGQLGEGQKRSIMCSLACSRSLVYYLPSYPTLVPMPLHHLAPGGTTLDFLRTLNCCASFAVGHNLMALPGPLLLSL